MQSDADVPPVVLRYVPEGQGVKVLLLCIQKLPAGHGVLQLEATLAELYLPEGQLTHVFEK